MICSIFTIAWRAGGIFSVSLIEKRSGYILFRTNGDKFFENETGGHRWQRVPPTERRGRVQTSTVTVAALDDVRNDFHFDESLMVVEYYRAPGKGGQKRNKVETACRLKYQNLIVTCCDERAKRQNYESALKVLKQRLAEHHRTSVHTATNSERQKQIGSGQRGDKIRTYRSQDDVMIDHRTDQKARLSDVLRGNWPY